MNATTTRNERLAALLVFLAVALGAMGAHALEARLAGTPKGLDIWKTAALYHLVHAVALYFLAARHGPHAWWLLFSGILLFSGSLYIYALTQVKFLVFVTPIGGLLFMLGWLTLAVRKSRPQ
jgi:uncharacterized membrane protein YgdD (TMEM256/DUF423 family)